MDQMPSNYAGSVLKALAQQNFHPQVLLGAATYSNQLVTQSGGAANVNGAYLSQNLALYLGTDQTAVPAVGTFLHWVQMASPGFSPDLFTAYGWLSANLFVQGLQERRLEPQPGLAAPGAVQGDVVQRERLQRPVQPGGQDAAELLPDRHGDQRAVRPVAGQPADHRQHRRVPLRRLVHRQARHLTAGRSTGTDEMGPGGIPREMREIA